MLGPMLMLRLLLATAALVGSGHVHGRHVITAEAEPGGLLAAQMKARVVIASQPPEDTEDVHVVVAPGVHVSELYSPCLLLTCFPLRTNTKDAHCAFRVASRLARWLSS